MEPSEKYLTAIELLKLLEDQGFLAKDDDQDIDTIARDFAGYLGEPVPTDKELYAMTEGMNNCLDDLVHEFASEVGSHVNNDGVQAQVDFLILYMGRDELYESLKSQQED
jgi:hypothetical protein